MWLFALFDLPVQTKSQKRVAARFRIDLQQLGFSMIQWSVYARHFRTEDAAGPVRQAIVSSLPPEGHVRLLAVTDRQYGKMEVFLGTALHRPEKEPSLFELF